jgi:putative membrane protein
MLGKDLAEQQLSIIHCQLSIAVSSCISPLDFFSEICYNSIRRLIKTKVVTPMPNNILTEKATDVTLLNEHLALERTNMANERTLLSYFRTFISVLLTGVGFIQLTHNSFFIAVGIVLAVISPSLIIIGFMRFINLRNQLKRTKGNLKNF